MKYSSLIWILWIHEIRVKPDKKVTFKQHYHMACSVNRQDEPNPALWLATRAGKMELSCPLRTIRRVRQEKFPRKPYNKSFIAQACFAKMTGYWPCSVLASLWSSTGSVSVHTYKVHSLGSSLEIDRELTFQSHVDRLCKKSSLRIGILKKIRHCLVSWTL